MRNEYLYPRGPQKDPRLSPRRCNIQAANDTRPSPWLFCTVVPRTDVKGRHFGKDHPEYQSVLEQHRVTGEYRVRPLTDVIEDNNG